jgi:O-succinylbenzoate synthase
MIDDHCPPPATTGGPLDPDPDGSAVDALEGADGAEPAARVVSAEVLRVRMTLHEPFVTGFGSTPVRTTVLVRIEDAEGRVGWGEAPALDHPFYLPETTSTTYAVVTEYALPLALRAGVTEPAAVAETLLPVRGNGFARAGVEAAYWALASARTGTSIAGLLGGTRERVAVGESISIKPTIDETLDEVAGRLGEGYRRIKLKIRPGWDVDLVRAVRESFGDVLLTVDANAVYTLDDLEVFLALDGFGLLCIEQPFAYDDIAGSAALQRRLQTSVCLDEAVTGPRAAREALTLGACRNINLKPPRVGGLTAAREIHDLCAERGVPVWVGGMLESGIGRAGNLAVASLPGVVEPADMSPAAVLFTEDLVDPTFRVEPDGFVAVPTTPGLGFEVERSRVEARTIQRAVWDPGTATMRDTPVERREVEAGR